MSGYEIGDTCMVLDAHGNAFQCFDYTPEALEAEAKRLRGWITVESTVEIVSFTSSLDVTDA